MFKIVRFVQSDTIFNIQEAIDFVLNAVNFVMGIFDQPYRNYIDPQREIR